VWLPEDEKMMICLAVSTQYRRATNRQTDRQTSCYSINAGENRVKKVGLPPRIGK